jgi:hypothetical protein
MIILDSTGLFFRTAGCEGAQSAWFGKYKISKKGFLSFKLLPLDSIYPVKQIKQTEKTNDSVVTVRLFDRVGKLISSSFRIALIDTAKKSETFWLDRDGEVRINRFRYKVLILDQLALIYNDAQTISIDDHSLEIHFTLPEMFLIYPETNIGGPTKLQLHLKEDGLYDNKGKRKLYELTK